MRALHDTGCSCFNPAVCSGKCTGDGSGGDSIYGGTFKDEVAGLKLKHAATGVLSMANAGKHTNRSQFFFTLAAAPACDGKHVVVGTVISGLEVLARIGNCNSEPGSSIGTAADLGLGQHPGAQASAWLPFLKCQFKCWCGTFATDSKTKEIYARDLMHHDHPGPPAISCIGHQ